MQKYWTITGIWCEIILGYKHKSHHYACDKIIKFYIFMSDAYILSIISCWNTASSSLFLHGIWVKLPLVKRHSAE